MANQNESRGDFEKEVSNFEVQDEAEGEDGDAMEETKGSGSKRPLKYIQ